MRAVVLAVFTLSFAACGLFGGTEPVSVSQAVSAASGGAIAVGATGASLAIAPAALAADTTITVEATAPAATLPAADSVHGRYYDFGPTGTAFARSAVLTLPVAGTPGAGLTAVISTFDGTTWTDLPTSLTGGMLVAPVTHFSGFAVRYVKGTGAAVDCAAVRAPCGGDLVGTWHPSTVCGLEQMALENCPDSSATLADVVDGSVTFTSGGAYSASLAYTESFSASLSAACLANNQIADCAAVQAKLRGSERSQDYPSLVTVTCAAVAGGGCTCNGVGSGDVARDETGTYQVSGTTVALNRTGAAPDDSPKGYCVDGSTLWFRPSADGPEVFAFSR